MCSQQKFNKNEILHFFPALDNSRTEYTTYYDNFTSEIIYEVHYYIQY